MAIESKFDKESVAVEESHIVDQSLDSCPEPVDPEPVDPEDERCMRLMSEGGRAATEQQIFMCLVATSAW